MQIDFRSGCRKEPVIGASGRHSVPGCGLRDSGGEGRSTRVPEQHSNTEKELVSPQIPHACAFILIITFRLHLLMAVPAWPRSLDVLSGGAVLPEHLPDKHI